MSSENSRVSRIRQFGLYKGVDAKTQEFLRLSRKRQIRRGCVCATVSTAITVLVVVATILAFEYFISASPKSIQRKTSEFDSRYTRNSSNDKPFADKLDSTDFGFDRMSFKRMPFLVNAMEEKSYINFKSGSSMESEKKTRKLISRNYNLNYPISNIRRTSPHPFGFEYEAPTPTPFFNTQGWLETYRHAQRLKNLEKVIKYLEGTMNAKFGDVHINSLSNNRGFDSVRTEPVQSKFKDEGVEVTTYSPKLSQETIKIFEALTDNTFQSDLLYGFKPDSPGDINALAESSTRSPAKYPKGIKNIDKSPSRLMFKPIPDISRGCLGSVCSQYQDSIEKSIYSIFNDVSNDNNLKMMTSTVPKSFSVMFDLYKSKTDDNNEEIHITTVRPKLQFKRKSPFNAKPAINYYLPQNKLTKDLHGIRNENVTEIVTNNSQTREKESDYVQFNGNLRRNVYLNKIFMAQNVTTKIDTPKSIPINTSAESNNLFNRQREETDVNPLTSTIKVTDLDRFRPFGFTSTRKYDPVLVHFEFTSELPALSRNQPEILKFSQEDAKMPDISDEDYPVEILKVPKHFETVTNKESSGKNTEINSSVNKRLDAEATTVMPYVPLINGHYRSLNLNSRTINNWINEKSDTQRTKNLELPDPPCLRKPQYVEIKRKNWKKSDESEEDF